MTVIVNEIKRLLDLIFQVSRGKEFLKLLFSSFSLHLIFNAEITSVRWSGRSYELHSDSPGRWMQCSREAR